MSKKFSSKIKNNNTTFEMPPYRVASVPSQFDHIKVVVGSEEEIFEETYVIGVLPNNRVARFKKSALVFSA